MKTLSSRTKWADNTISTLIEPEELNNFVTSVGHNLAAICNRISTMSVDKNTMCLFEIREITGEEIFNETKRFKNKRSLDYFSISNVLKKAVNPALCQILKILFKKMIVECSFPDWLKVSMVFPV